MMEKPFIQQQTSKKLAIQKYKIAMKSILFRLATTVLSNNSNSKIENTNRNEQAGVSKNVLLFSKYPSRI